MEKKKKKDGQTLTHMICLHNYFTFHMLIRSTIYAPTDLPLMLKGTKFFQYKDAQPTLTSLFIRGLHFSVFLSFHDFNFFSLYLEPFHKINITTTKPGNNPNK